jgi:hypothetical protein
MRQGTELLLLLAAHLVLTALPGIAATLYAASRGVREVPVLLAIGLAATGLLAAVAFWAYYADPVAGESFSYLLLFASVLASGWVLYRRQVERALLRQLGVPLALWALGSAFILYLGFLHGGAEQPLGMAMTRFSPGMPNDNAIPYFFGEWFFEHGHRGTPPLFSGDWLSSDRPPLQSGYLLAQRPFGPSGTELHYQVLGVVLQQLWIIGLWSLLLAARVGTLTRGLVMLAVLVSDVAITNAFFVWPKLLPAGMLLAAAALLLTPLWEGLRRSYWGAALVAALFAAAMLGHGSSIFGIVPLALVAGYRALPSWRWVGVALLVGLVLLAPWSAYQRYGDPPGDRLIKWQLAGVIDLDERSATATLLDSYREAGFGGTLHNKAENFVVIGGGGPMAEHISEGASALVDGDFKQVVEDFRNIFFFNLVPSLGLLLLAPVAMFLARRRGRLRSQEWRFALTCFAVFAIGVVFWALTLFGNEAARTVIHQGSLLLPVLAFCGAVAGLRAVLPRFAIYFVAASALLTLAVYVPAFAPSPGSSYSPFSALAAAFALGGFGALALGGSRGPIGPALRAGRPRG